MRGDTFSDEQNFAAARLEYQSIERNTTYKETPAGQKAPFRIVNILRITKDYDAAVEMLDRLEDSPTVSTQAEAYYQSARIAFDRESYDEARTDIQEVKRRVPNHIEAAAVDPIRIAFGRWESAHHE